MSRPQSVHVVVNSRDPSAAGECDRCGRWWQSNTLSWQMQWAGTRLYNTGSLVCTDCLDDPNENLRTIILPPDPTPVMNARVPNLEYENAGPVQSTLAATVSRGGVLIPVVSAVGFQIGDDVTIQLINATFAQTRVTGVNLGTNFLSILNPILFAAPFMGVVSVTSPD